MARKHAADPAAEALKFYHGGFDATGFNLTSRNKDARKLWAKAVTVLNGDGLIVIRGHDGEGKAMTSYLMKLGVDDIPKFIRALEWAQAGALGRMAMDAEATARLDPARTYLRRLLDVCELNQDDMEPGTRALIDEVCAFLDNTTTGVKDKP